MFAFLKWLFSPKCKHEVDMDNLQVYACKKCKQELNGIEYSTGGIGKTDSYFSWQVKSDLSNPDSSLSKMVKSIDWEERIKKAKEQVEKEKLLKENKKR